MGKQLSIVVGIVDKATAPLRAIGAGVGGIGGVFTKLGSVGSRAIGAIFTGLTSLRGLLLGGAIAGAVYKLISGFGSTADEIDNVGKAAERLHLPIQTLSELRYAAKLNNVEFESLAGALEVADKNIGQLAVTGKSKASEAFATLGVNIRDANGQLRGLDDLLPDILDNLAAADPAKQTFLASKIFGPEGDKFLLFLQDGTNTLRQYNEEAKRLGVVFTPEQYAAAQAYNDSVSRLKAAFTGVYTILIQAFGPPLTKLLNAASYGLAEVARSIGNIVYVIAEVVASGNKFGRDLLLGTLLRIVDAAIDQVWTRVLAFGARVFEFIRLIVGNILDDIIEGVGSAAEGISYVTGELLRLIGEQIGKILAPLREGLEDLGSSVADVWKAAGINVKEYTDSLVELRNNSAQVAVDSVRDIIAIGGAWQESGAAAGIAKRQYSEALAEISPITLGAIGEGFRGATVELIKSASDVVGYVQRGVLDVANGLSTNLSSAIYETIAGTKSLKAAFVDFLSSTLKQVSELILQFLILRAVAGIAKGFFGGGAQDVTDLQGFVGDTPQLAAVNSGGYIGRGGSLLHFAGGGLVPGPNVNRDVVPALLTPGEGVLNRTGVATLGRGNLAALNSGQPVGGSITLNQTVVVQGGGDVSEQSLRGIRKATYDAMLDVITKNPGKARSFRAALGVA